MRTQPVKFPAAQILVYAKAPVENQVKTRLIPELGAARATALYKAMLEQTLTTVVESQLCNIKLLCTPDSDHPYFMDLHQQYSVELGVQQGTDLGQRMLVGATKSLHTYKSVVLLGTDCLQLTESLLGQVLAGLASNANDVIVTPAEDGGYVLLGLNKVDSRLFADIEWGTASVMEKTRNALRQLKWKWREMPALRDLDTYEDIEYIYKNKHQYPLNTGVRNLLQTIFQ